MNNSPNFAQLFRYSLAALLVGATLVVICYFFVDRPVAFFIHDQRFPDYIVLALKWLTYPPPIMQAWTPVVLAILVVRRIYGPFHRCEMTVLAACVSMVLADQFRKSLGFTFGRYWPDTWINNNLSLIRNGEYGFHFFHGTDNNAFGSFPSGHTARTVAIAAVVWIGYPRWWPGCILVSVAVAVGLLGMNYHFVGDVIAGGFVGGIVGAYTAYFCGLKAADHATDSSSQRGQPLD